MSLLLLGSGLLVYGAAIAMHLRLMLLTLIWLVGLGLGTINWTQLSSQGPIKVTLLQADVALEEKWLPQYLAPTLDYYFKQTYKHLDSDLIVWPETAIATYWDYIQPAMAALTSSAKAEQTQIVSGTIMRESTAANANYYNALVAFSQPNEQANSASQGYYHKQRLVPFGEYIPFENSLRGMIGFFDLPMSSFKLPQQEQGLLSQPRTYRR
jgi:apolipoprotein N-acyltransferase